MHLAGRDDEVQGVAEAAAGGRVGGRGVVVDRASAHLDGGVHVLPGADGAAPLEREAAGDAVVGDEPTYVDAHPGRLVGDKGDTVVGTAVRRIGEVLASVVPLDGLRHFDAGDVGGREIEDAVVVEHLAGELARELGEEILRVRHGVAPSLVDRGSSDRPRPAPGCVDRSQGEPP